MAAVKPLHTFTDHAAAVVAVAFSPDGRTLVTGGYDGLVCLRRLDAEALPLRLTQNAPVNAVAFSPDGRLLAMATGDQHEPADVVIWDITTDEPAVLRRLAGHEKGVICAAFFPDDITLATGGFDGAVRLWDMANGAETRCLHGHRAPVTSVAVSPGGRCLASAGLDATVRLWTADGDPVHVLRGHSHAVFAAAFVSEAVVVSGSYDGTLRLWDIAEGSAIGGWHGHAAGVLTVAVDRAAGIAASGDAAGQAALWNCIDNRELALLGRWQAHEGKVNSVAFSPDGSRLATAGADRSVKVWAVSEQLTAAATGASDSC